MGKNRPTSDTAPLNTLGDRDRYEPPPVPPVPVQHPAGQDPQEQVEDGHDGTELHCVEQCSDNMQIYASLAITGVLLYLVTL